MHKRGEIFVLCMLLAVMLACSVTGPEPTVTPTSSPTVDSKATEMVRSTQTQQAQETSDALAVQQTEEAATAMAVAEETQAEETKAAVQATLEQAKLEKTQAAEPMFALVQELYEDGYLTSTDGRYMQLEDFQESWAQMAWYRGWWAADNLVDFVLVADMAWSSASDVANWQHSGCGFYFRARNSGEDHYVAFVLLDGYVILLRSLKDNIILLGEAYYGKPDVPKGGVEFGLAVQGSTFHIFVNGKKVLTRQDTYLTDGDVAYSLLSGTNKDYGTRCTMTNVDVWDLK